MTFWIIIFNLLNLPPFSLLTTNIILFNIKLFGDSISTLLVLLLHLVFDRFAVLIIVGPACKWFTVDLVGDADPPGGAVDPLLLAHTVYVVASVWLGNVWLVSMVIGVYLVDVKEWGCFLKQPWIHQCETLFIHVWIHKWQQCKSICIIYRVTLTKHFLQFCFIE